MPTINQLALMSQLSSGDQIPVYSVTNGDARRISVNTLLEFFQQTFASPEMSTNIFTPGTGFSIDVPASNSIERWILIQPLGTLASGTVVLPLNTEVPDGTEVLITTTQQITSFTLSPNGAMVVYGAPSALSAEDFFRMRFVAAMNSWYRIA